MRCLCREDCRPPADSYRARTTRNGADATSALEVSLESQDHLGQEAPDVVYSRDGEESGTYIPHYPRGLQLTMCRALGGFVSIVPLFAIAYLFVSTVDPSRATAAQSHLEVIRASEGDSSDTVLAKAEKNKERADGLEAKAEDLLAKSKQKSDAATSLQAQIDDARKVEKEQEELMKDLKKQLRDAEALAKSKKKWASSAVHDVDKLSKEADRVHEAAQAYIDNATEFLDAAKDLESSARAEIAAVRACYDLPGIKLGPDRASLLQKPPIAMDMSLNSFETCRSWCLDHRSCTQAVFTDSYWTGGNSTCELFSTSDEPNPTSFLDGYNSTICGSQSDSDNLVSALKKVYAKKPWIPEPTKCAWAGENCMESKCCADNKVCDWQWSNCQYYTCNKQDDFFAHCMLGGPAGLGGSAVSEAPKAKDGQVTQGTSLFCFSVVMWNEGPTMQTMDPEGMVADHWKTNKHSILECEDYMFVDGLPTGSVHNIDSFTHAWTVVRDDGRWKKHDWTIKVDVDTVFLPERLRWHIQQWALPQGGRAYVRNTAFKFHFLGAIEVLSREGLQLYYDRSWECDKHIGKQGGEDYWLLSCLEGIGLNYITDYALLNDKYAGHENCNNDWSVAFHFYKSVRDWDACYAQTQAAGAAAAAAQAATAAA
mmetsp:Transcript_79691/g.165555  ORF Transcript_79691/g.165555 Transcript_79691/m.165555 type:complete len:653 (+) Transcript_79691:187-2145(+)|eukprot:CAMPEP_0206488772 /NCGR_PEP_ID=MMETSP0324_2-20121206/42671_1 /ASSEMBLY_ACC=CAM_ASM_000836 /TAXON_ID=2866 /ORGANISM="Crypthecodinium cohnii, Strain Seligo" /LENGTH=652 /DNA_ID=CAMNT_0053967979 /DNA_START=117 /DNA_END=2075 /DNA_ORIENTATION=-